MKKFNTKQYEGKSRIYRPVTGALNVLRLWIWSEVKKEYLAPTFGGLYEARRYEISLGGEKKRVKRSFSSLQNARAWQSFQTDKKDHPTPVSGPLFNEVVEEWRIRRFDTLGAGTKLQYERMLEKHFQSLAGVPIKEIGPKEIDRWIDALKSSKGHSVTRRMSFDHELTLLGVILRYFSEYNDDSAFVFPIKKRHREAVKNKVRATPKQKDLSEKEFFLFRNELRRGSYGVLMAALATVQYYQALRISEAAALYWEDIRIDEKNPVASRVSIVRSVLWPRKRGMESYVKAGFKNSVANDGVKEQPLLREAFLILKELDQTRHGDLVFSLDRKPLEFRTIQYAYDSAFKRAGLPYTGTHVLRHGGCRRIYNQTGDLAIAQQHLGNTDMKSTLVYAQRHKEALTDFVRKEWEAAETA